MDLSLFQSLHSIAGQSGLLDGLIIFFARHLPYILTIGAFFYVLTRRSWQHRILNAISALLVIILSWGVISRTIKFFYMRPRPYEALDLEPLLTNTTSSFPSGHTTLLFALGFLIFSLNRFWGWIFLALSLLVGVSRIIAGVHWPSDILGGIAVGALGFLIIKGLLKKKTKQKKVAK